MPPSPSTAWSTITHCGELSDSIPTRSPGRIPIFWSPARKRAAAFATSAQEWSRQVLLDLSLRNVRSPYFCARLSKACASVAKFSLIDAPSEKTSNRNAAQSPIPCSTSSTPAVVCNYEKGRHGSQGSARCQCHGELSIFGFADESSGFG